MCHIICAYAKVRQFAAFTVLILAGILELGCNAGFTLSNQA
jgi:hypothetical protein